ncbi:hypothetical protein O3P69_002753 [Scylla paramamosain]|uniref:Uncharacterized protein n=1 Tax=Scylla paramamosain TaxID=85552 RepID=A0AAW0UNC9_SCYPA
MHLVSARPGDVWLKKGQSETPEPLTREVSIVGVRLSLIHNYVAGASRPIRSHSNSTIISRRWHHLKAAPVSRRATPIPHSSFQPFPACLPGLDHPAFPFPNIPSNPTSPRLSLTSPALLPAVLHLRPLNRE